MFSRSTAGHVARAAFAALLVLVASGCPRAKPAAPPTARPAAWDEPQQTQRADEKKAIDSATQGHP